MEMQMTSRSLEALDLHVRKCKGRGKIAGRQRVKCVAASSFRAAKQISEENGGIVESGIDGALDSSADSKLSDEIKIESSGGKVGSLLKLIRQHHAQLQGCSSQAQWVSTGGCLISPQQAGARRLRSLFALAQHLDDISDASGLGAKLLSMSIAA